MGLLSSPAATARVIVVDDDDYVRDVTEMILAGAGHTVRTTANGYEALRWLEEQSCDLLILDLRMPKIDGLALYGEVLARWPTGGPRVLFVSGFTEAAAYEGPLKTLDAAVLVKPFSLDALTRAVERALATP
jgi:DNA-binding NtrC family response regulator